MQTWQKPLNIWQRKPFVRALKKQLSGAEVFLVGGAVRDAIIGRQTADFDLVIRNVPKPKLETFLKKHGKVDLVGKRFGVYKFRPKNWTGPAIDIALPRTEHSLHMTGAYKDFKINSNARLSIEDDLSRRDFTINAMAWDIFNNKLIDPFQGLSDIKKKTIRAVGVPYLRFKEDYSRMLRAIRFSCQLDFVLAQTVFQGIKTGMKKINIKVKGQRVVPYEVIASEINKALYLNPLKTIDLLDQTGGLQALMPELLKMKNCPQPEEWHSEGDVWQHTLLAIKNLESKEFKKEFKKQTIPVEVVWALLFHDLGKPYTIIKADRFRFNNHDNVSADKFAAIARDLRLSAAGVNTEMIEKIIRKHMLLAHGDPEEMKATTIEKYFFNQNFPGSELLMQIYADVLGSIPKKTGKPYDKNYFQLKQKINKVGKKIGSKKQLIKPLITGHDIIKEFKLTQSPQIGALLTIAREAQLNGKIKTKQQALALVKKQI